MSGKILPAIFLAFGGAYVLFSVLIGSGNTIGSLAFYLCVSSVVLALLNPRPMLYWLVILAGYSDLMKRAMIFDDRVTLQDVMWVRALCPLTLAGIVAGTVLRGLTKETALLGRRQLACLALACAGFSISAVSAMRGSGINEGLQQLADGASYIFMIFIVAAHFQTADALVRFVKYCLLIFIPVPLYGMKQQFFGLSDFEIEYLSSGLTILSKHLLDVRPRPFSTLTDCSPYGTTCALLACFSLMVWGYYKKTGERAWRVSPFILWALYVAGCVTSMSRISNANWLLPVLLLPFFSSRVGTGAVYGALTGGFAFACVFAKDIKVVIERATLWALDMFGNSAIGEQFARFWTLGDRLDGMNELATNPKMWTLFGYGPQLTKEMMLAGEVHSHDTVTTMLLELGWVPCAALLLVLAFLLVKVHRSIFAIRGTPEFGLCVWLVATVMGLLFHNVFAGGVTSTFPVNLFFWLMIGGVIAAIGSAWREPDKIPAVAPQPHTPFPRPMQPPRFHPAMVRRA
jgi:hypothetical protein